jgi:hypothetical protein
VKYAERTSFNSVVDSRSQSLCVGVSVCDGAAVYSEGSRAETVPVQNRRGPSRHPEYANQAERVRSERVGVGGGPDGEHDGAEADL